MGKLLTPKQTRLNTLVLLLQPSMKPLEYGTSKLLRMLTEFCNLPLTYETYYVLAMFTGCRRGELCALKWSDVTIYDNYDWATINISRSRSSVPGKGVVEGSTKSGRSRTVAVDSDIAGLIACLYTEKEREANERGEEISEYIFTNEHGKLIHPDTFSKTLRKIKAYLRAG